MDGEENMLGRCGWNLSLRSAHAALGVGVGESPYVWLLESP